MGPSKYKPRFLTDLRQTKRAGDDRVLQPKGLGSDRGWPLFAHRWISRRDGPGAHPGRGQVCEWSTDFWGSEWMVLKNIQCGAPKIAKLVYNSNNYGLWMLMVLITIVNGVYKTTNITGGAHIVVTINYSNMYKTIVTISININYSNYHIVVFGCWSINPSTIWLFNS